MTIKTADLVVIGSGPAGYNAALYGSRAGLSVLILTGMEKGGQLTKTHQIDNWLGANEAEPHALLAKMEAHATAYGAKILMDTCQGIEENEKGFLLQGEGGETYQAKAVVLATGASAKYLGLESEETFKGKGVSACATCDGFFYRKKPVLVVGGGNSAVEEALYLSKIASHVTLVHRRESFRAEHILLEQLNAQVQAQKITLKTPYVLKEVLGDASGVTGVLLQNLQKNEEEKLSLDGVFVAIGHQPNGAFLGDLVQKDEHGFVLRGAKAGQEKWGESCSSKPGIFVAGDIGDSRYRQAITAAAMGCQAALDAKAYMGAMSLNK